MDLGAVAATTFEKLYETAPAAMLLIDSNRRIMLANNAAENLFGYGHGELAGTEVDALLPEAAEEERAGAVEGSAEPGTPESPVPAPELWGARRDGTRFPVDVVFGPLDLRQGESAVVAVVRDVTKRHEMEQALRQNMVIFERMFEFAPDAMIVVNSEGVIARANAQSESMFGYTRDELLGAPLEILLPVQFRERHHQYREQYFSAPRLRPMGIGLQLMGRRKDGAEFPVDIMLSPLESDQESRVALAVIRDMTVRAKLVEQEQMRRALEQKETLIKEIHHRVKNNLQVISSLLSLQADQLGAWVEERLLDTQTRVRSIALIHEKLSRTDDLAQLDFPAYLKDLIDDLKGSYGETHAAQIRLEADSRYFGLDTAIPCGLIVVELVSNALKYAFPEHRQGHVLVQFQVMEDGRCALRVSDDGVGIPDRVDVDKPATLGLQLVQALTRQLSGHVVIRRSEGTTVEIIFSPPREIVP